MSKAISNIIASLLMLIITLTLVGVAWLYISGIFTSKTQTISIVDAFDGIIIVRNDGDQPITDITATVDGQKVPLIHTPQYLVAYYPFDEGGGNIVNDLGLFHNNGQLGGTSTQTNEVFNCTSMDDTWLPLDQVNINPGESVANSTNSFVNGVDYSMDYLDGNIKCLSTGSMTKNFKYSINYTYYRTPPSWVAGKYDSGLDFNGRDNDVEVPNTPSLNITNQVTMEAWIYFRGLTNLGDVDIIINKESVPGLPIPYEIAIQDVYNPSIGCGNDTYAGYLVWYLGNVTTDALTFGHACGWKLGSKEPIPTDQWTHVAITYNGTTIKTYVNGELQYTFSGSKNIAKTTSMLRIGNRGTDHPASPFNGIIDEVRIYNKGLTEEQLGLDYKGAISLLPGELTYLRLHTPILSVPGTHTIRVCSPSMCVPYYVHIT